MMIKEREVERQSKGKCTGNPAKYIFSSSSNGNARIRQERNSMVTQHQS